MEILVVATSIGATSRSCCGRVFILGSVEIARRLHLFPDSFRRRPVVCLSSHSHSARPGCRRFFVQSGSAELAFLRPLLSTYTGCIRDNGPNLRMRFSLDAAEILGVFCDIVCDLRWFVGICPIPLDFYPRRWSEPVGRANRCPARQFRSSVKTMNLGLHSVSAPPATGRSPALGSICISMKIRLVFLLFVVLSLSGCATSNAIDDAQADRHRDEKSDKEVGPVHWEYYGLLPITVPCDIVTSPFQLFIYLALREGH